MVNCDNCGSDVPEVWRHRQFAESMTHRSISWICRACHPSVPETVGAATAERGPVMADGGTGSLACPSCGGPTVDGQGLFACTDCAWSGTM